MKRGQGALLLVLLLALAWVKQQQGLLPEMLWISFLSTAVLAFGLLLNNARLSATGFLLQLAVALPAYVGYLLQHGESHWLSWLLHLLAPLFGWLDWRRRTLPPATAAHACALYVAALLLGRYASPAGLNVNFAHHAFNPLGLADVWSQRLLNTALVVAALVVTQLLFNRLSPRSGQSG